MQEVPLNNERQPDLQKGVIACCSAIHQSVERNSVRYFEELRRHNYVIKCIWVLVCSLITANIMVCFLRKAICQGTMLPQPSTVTSANSVSIPPALQGLDVLLVKKQAWIVETEGTLLLFR